MNYLPPSNTEKDLLFSSDSLSDVLDKLSDVQEDSCLQIVYNSITFFLHFNKGKLIYGTNSLAPFERLERHLRRLSNSNPKLDNSLIKQPRLRFHKGIESYTQFPADYQGIIWLSKQAYLDSFESLTVIRRITREIFESLLCISESFQYKLLAKPSKIPELCQFDLISFVAQCQKRLEAWQAFSEKIWSSYQRPYLVNEKTQAIGSLTAEQNQTICKLLKGLNFRQISALLDLDELAIAKILYPSMLDNTIVIRDPKTPFDRLPRLPQKEKFELLSEADWRGEDSGFQINSNSKQTVHVLEDTWKIAYVDDDTPAVANFVGCLKPSLFSVLVVEDALNAFAKLIEFEPDLIALNINMPHINGYELCNLLRNHHNFQTIPIVLLHQTYEPIDAAKFKQSGATQSLAKSFDRTKLLNMIFNYLR